VVASGVAITTSNSMSSAKQSVPKHREGNVAQPSSGVKNTKARKVIARENLTHETQMTEEKRSSAASGSNVKHLAPNNGKTSLSRNQMA